MIKYIAYCRKSTDEPDRQILSIEAQVAELKEFAAKENLEVIDYVFESKTAKEPGREKFEAVLRRIEYGEAGGILAWHADRLARNSIDGGKIIYLLDTGKLLDLKFPTLWFENTPQGKFMLSIAFGQSKYYVDNLSENVKRGYRQKLRRGEYPHKAPFGYFNDPKTKEILVDRKSSKYIQHAYKLFVTGGYTFVDMCDFFTKNKCRNDNGHTFRKDKVRRILTNPFYIGLMELNGEIYEAKHKPIIGKKLFDRVQKIIRLKSRKHKNNKYRFDFLGFIRCAECDSMITAEKHKKYYKRRDITVEYTYYRCSKKKGYCSQKYIGKDEIERQFRNLIRRVSLTDFVAKKFLSWAKEDSFVEKEKAAEEIELVSQELGETEERLDRLLEGYLDKVVDVGEYQKKKNELLQMKLLLGQKIKELSSQGNEWLEPFEEFINVALQGQKIACGKNNCSDLVIGAKTVGSNYFLRDQKLSILYKKEGWQALAASVGAASGESDFWKSADLRARADSNRRSSP